jgi:hypothetical protein
LASGAVATPAEAFIPTRWSHEETMQKRILLEERVAQLARSLEALSVGVDLQPERDQWLRDIEDETPQKVFRILVLYLASTIPGFSADELRRLALSVLVKPIEEMPDKNVVIEHTLRRTRAIIDEMLPDESSET